MTSKYGNVYFRARLSKTSLSAFESMIWNGLALGMVTVLREADGSRCIRNKQRSIRRHIYATADLGISPTETLCLPALG